MQGDGDRDGSSRGDSRGLETLCEIVVIGRTAGLKARGRLGERIWAEVTKNVIIKKYTGWASEVGILVSSGSVLGSKGG